MPSVFPSRRRRIVHALGLALSVTLVFGCGDPATPSERGRLTLSLTDAPFPFDLVAAATVHIDRVDARLQSSTGVATWHTVDDTDRITNLLELQNGVTDDLGSIDLPVGTIDQLRLVVTDASIELVDGRVFDLDVPSGSSSGIKVRPAAPIAVGEGENTEVLLDFDVSQSFRAIPNAPTKVDDIRNFQFHPVVRADVIEKQDATILGRVWADVNTPADTTDDYPLGSAAVTLMRAGAEVATTSTDGDGKFAFLHVDAGDYELVFTRIGFEPETVAVTAALGDVLTVDDVRMSGQVYIPFRSGR